MALKVIYDKEVSHYVLDDYYLGKLRFYRLSKYPSYAFITNISMSDNILYMLCNHLCINYVLSQRFINESYTHIINNTIFYHPIPTLFDVTFSITPEIFYAKFSNITTDKDRNTYFMPFLYETNSDVKVYYDFRDVNRIKGGFIAIDSKNIYYRAYNETTIKQIYLI